PDPSNLLSKGPAGLSVQPTGDWTGTFDGQEGSYYLDYNNLTNTPSAQPGVSVGANQVAYSADGTNLVGNSNLTYNGITLNVNGRVTANEVQLANNQYLYMGSGREVMAYDNATGQVLISKRLDLPSNGNPATAYGNSKFSILTGAGGTEIASFDETNFMKITTPDLRLDGIRDAYALGTGASSGAVVPRTLADMKSDIQLSQEEVEDLSGAMFSGGIQSGVAVAYDDVAGKLNIIAADISSTNELGELFQQSSAPAGKNGDWWRRSTDGSLYSYYNGWIQVYNNFSDGNWTRIGNDLINLNAGNLTIQGGSRIGVNYSTPQAWIDVEAAGAEYALSVRDNIASAQTFNVLGTGETQAAGPARLGNTAAAYGNQAGLSSGEYDASVNVMTWKDDRNFDYLHVPVDFLLNGQSYDFCLDIEGVAYGAGGSDVDRVTAKIFVRVVANDVVIDNIHSDNSNHEFFAYTRQEGSLYRLIIRFSNTRQNIAETYLSFTTRRGYIDTGLPSAPKLQEPVPSNLAQLPTI
ncbi:MAG: hypothetical protein AAFW73_26985, partial [Bacteroidota bacterium]